MNGTFPDPVAHEGAAASTPQPSIPDLLREGPQMLYKLAERVNRPVSRVEAELASLGEQGVVEEVELQSPGGPAVKHWQLKSPTGGSVNDAVGPQ